MDIKRKGAPINWYRVRGNAMLSAGVTVAVGVVVAAVALLAGLFWRVFQWVTR
jgi:hypothetical protein